MYSVALVQFAALSESSNTFCIGRMTDIRDYADKLERTSQPCADAFSEEVS